MGVSEQDMVSFAAGLAISGMLPVVHTYVHAHRSFQPDLCLIHHNLCLQLQQLLEEVLRKHVHRQRRPPETHLCRHVRPLNNHCTYNRILHRNTLFFQSRVPGTQASATTLTAHLTRPSTTLQL
jgi:hypothetical protein